MTRRQALFSQHQRFCQFLKCGIFCCLRPRFSRFSRLLLLTVKIWVSTRALLEIPSRCAPWKPLYGCLEGCRHFPRVLLVFYPFSHRLGGLISCKHVSQTWTFSPTAKEIVLTENSACLDVQVRWMSISPYRLQNQGEMRPKRFSHPSRICPYPFPSPFLSPTMLHRVCNTLVATAAPTMRHKCASFWCSDACFVCVLCVFVLSRTTAPMPGPLCGRTALATPTTRTLRTRTSPGTLTTPSTPSRRCGRPASCVTSTCSAVHQAVAVVSAALLCVQVMSGKCLDATDTTTVVINDCSGAATQQWTYDSTTKLLHHTVRLLSCLPGVVVRFHLCFSLWLPPVGFWEVPGAAQKCVGVAVLRRTLQIHAFLRRVPVYR